MTEDEDRFEVLEVLEFPPYMRFIGSFPTLDAAKADRDIHTMEASPDRKGAFDILLKDGRILIIEPAPDDEA